MDSYKVNQNMPIKLKVSISTEAITFTFVSLNDPDEDGKFIPDFAFIVTPNTGWKQINKGKKVKDRTVRIRTILDFHVNFPDEVTFNLAVENAKENYISSLSGGIPARYDFVFEDYRNYERNSAEFFSEISLI